jgi:hypothetical protein
MSPFRENQSRFIQRFPKLLFDGRKRSGVAGMVLESIISLSEVGQFEPYETGAVF